MLTADTVVAPVRYGDGALLDVSPAPVPATPFMVVGRVNGREEAVRAATPAEALARMLDWLRRDEDASAVWYLREDWPGTVTVIGRPAPGVVGETRRCAHLFPLSPGMVLYGSMVSHCGAELFLTDIEWLGLGSGMPCECCLALSEPARPCLEGS
ncbi:hypothetical protein [Amycolatopsis taiwanensis]|uniref:Uncharacterized protein n=1 Tax=Amycolatopsis taiwanensis TaxID=342230 RepID=A0A9W6VJN5_9PSEU|nr:hypothetical protein [Amycolatopsis taiwanensis]GLY68691.1 hypothetical protein Atai01_53100 [Amycolatopsis taiwanensis]